MERKRERAGKGFSVNSEESKKPKTSKSFLRMGINVVVMYMHLMNRLQTRPMLPFVGGRHTQTFSSRRGQHSLETEGTVIEAVYKAAKFKLNFM